MSDPHEDTLKRQQIGQRRLEEAMERQETQQQRDQQLKVLDKWLITQEK